MRRASKPEQGVRGATRDQPRAVSARVLQPAQQGAVVLREEGVQIGVAGSTVERLHEAIHRRGHHDQVRAGLADGFQNVCAVPRGTTMPPPAGTLTSASLTRKASTPSRTYQASSSRS